MKKNKKALLGIAALAAVTVIGGSWAYWSQDLSAVNEFETGKFDTDITEEFTPPTPGEWVPGVEWEKNVTVTNSGDVKLAAIATINQMWIRTEDVNDPQKPTEVVLPKAGEYFDLMFEKEGDFKEYASQVNWGDVVALESLKDDAAAMLIGNTVTGLNDAEAADKWVLVKVTNNNKTNRDGAGFSDVQFIYNGIIGTEEDNKVTNPLVLGVTLNPAIETTVTKKVVENKLENNIPTVVTKTVTNPAYGYDSAKYTMTVNATTVQATEAAIKEIFAGKGVPDAQIKDFVEKHDASLIKEVVKKNQ